MKQLGTWCQDCRRDHRGMTCAEAWAVPEAQSGVEQRNLRRDREKVNMTEGRRHLRLVPAEK